MDESLVRKLIELKFEGKKSAVLRACQRALKHDERDATAHGFAADALYLVDNASALKHATRAVELDPSNVWFLTKLALCLIELQRGEEALEVINRAERLLREPEHGALSQSSTDGLTQRLRHMTWEALRQCDRLDEAVTTATKNRTLGYDDGGELSVTYVDLGKLEEAEQVFFSERSDSYAVNLTSIADALAARKDYVRALSYYRRRLAFCDIRYNSGPLVEYLMCLVQLGIWVEAEKLALYWTDIVPLRRKSDRTMLRLTLCMCLDQTSRSGAAAKMYLEVAPAIARAKVESWAGNGIFDQFFALNAELESKYSGTANRRQIK